jgi:hypothetical protein
MTLTIGPKIFSVEMLLFVLGSSRTVGSTQNPCGSVLPIGCYH